MILNKLIHFYFSILLSTTTNGYRQASAQTMDKQQVMSPTDLDEFSSFVEEKKPAPKLKMEPKVEKESQDDQVLITASDLRAIRERLVHLEKLEKSRREDDEAKKDASRIFKAMDVEMGQGLNLDDLGRSQAGHEVHQAPWGSAQGPMIGVPTPKQTKLSITKFSGKEQYKGLGSGFKEWGKRFLRQVNLAQRATGFLQAS